MTNLQDEEITQIILQLIIFQLERRISFRRLVALACLGTANSLRNLHQISRPFCVLTKNCASGAISDLCHHARQLS